MEDFYQIIFLNKTVLIPVVEYIGKQ